MKKVAAVKSSKKQPSPSEGPKPIRYIRVVELPLEKGDVFQGYQPEVIYVQDGKVVESKLISKPNLFEFAWSQAGEFIDPRNELKE